MCFREAWILAGPGFAVLNQFRPFHNSPNLSALSKDSLLIEYYVHIRQVSPQPSCDYTKQESYDVYHNISPVEY